MRKFHVRDFFDTHRRTWRAKENERFELEFDDGETLITTTVRTEISSWCWMIHEEYSRIPLLKSHHIGNGPLPYSKIQDVLSNAVRDVQIEYGDGGYDREHVHFLVYKINEKLYNNAIIEFSEYVRGVNSFDISRLYHYGPIKEIRDKLRPNQLSIDKANLAVTEIVMNDPTIALNPLVSDMRAGLLKMEQLLQIILVRGYNGDIDERIFNKPIMSNYFAGIMDPAETMMESTLASKSIIFTGAPLEQTEYANRKMQFTSQKVDLLIMNDCGTTYLSDIPLNKQRFKDMEGLYFMDPKRGKLRPLTSADSDLIGQKLGFRLPFNCGYRHYGCICAKCYGDLAYNVPYGSNIGHIASTMTQSEVSQRVLKVKHSESLSSVEPIRISERERAYILPAEAPNQILLNPEILKRNVKLMLRGTQRERVINASRLPILKRSDVQEGMSAAKHSQFKEVTFEIPTTTKTPMRYHVAVSRGARLSYLTNEFLRFFLDGGFYIQDDGYYHIDLKDWDFDKPVFELPNKHMNMKDFAAEVEVFIRSTKDASSRHLGQLRQLRQYDDPVTALIDLHELISDKVPVHITHLSIVMLSMMVSRNRPNDYHIPRAGEPVRFAKYDEVVAGSSLSVLFAYQGGRKALETIEQYENTDRPQHLLDPLIMPI